MNKYSSIEDCIATYPESTQKKLNQLRTTIQKAAPKAQEAISYGIPTFKLHGNLIHFAGYKHHIGLYPGAKAILAFKAELKGYKTSKGTIQFPIDKPIPLPLVRKIVAFCINQKLLKLKKKKAK